jgi:hypothetical protein
MGRGRKPSVAGLVERLDGAEETKRRLALILETLTGQRSVAEVGHQLGLSARRLYELWERRRQIEAEERAAFAAAVEEFHKEERRERGHAADSRLSGADQAAIDRVAEASRITKTPGKTVSPGAIR